MELPGYIISLVREGIPIELSYRDDMVRYCLNTGMKSDAHLSVRPDGKILISMRYGDKEVLDPGESDEETVRSIAHVINTQCRLGRPFSNDCWEVLFKKLGLTSET